MPESTRTAAQHPKTERIRNATQRERLITGMGAAVAREGYAAATIAQALTVAGVSRPTFYEYFLDKQDCFNAAVHDISERLERQIELAVEEGDPADARARALEAMVELAAAAPAHARTLMNETMIGGPRALDARDEGIAALARVIEKADQARPDRARTPDMCSRVLVGAVYRLLAQKLRRGEAPTPGMSKELLAWVATYEQPNATRRWSRLHPVQPPGESRHAPVTPLRAPAPSPPGSSRRDRRSNQRERILFATAQSAKEKGYTASSVADIARLAGVDHRAFNAHFDSKQDAYLAVAELGFRKTLAATAGAFFSRASWLERAWRAGLAFSEFLERNPAIAHIGFVEGYAVGPGAIRRMEQILATFTMFLGEGQRFRRSERADVSRTAIEAIAAANFEMAYLAARSNGGMSIRGLLPHAMFVTLAPFVGASEADSFIQSKIDEPPR